MKRNESTNKDYKNRPEVLNYALPNVYDEKKSK